MQLPDYHVHSAFSSDSETNIVDIMKYVIDNKIETFCITDHIDMGFPIYPDDPNMTFELDYDRYYKCMNQIKSEYNYNLLIGLEFGIMPELYDKQHDFINSHPELDYIIGSVHVIENNDPYRSEYFIGKNDFQSHHIYFERVLECVKTFKDYSALGHLDYILRCGPNKAENFIFNEHRDVIEDILKCIIQDGKSLEINTGSLYRGLDFIHPHIDILKLYKALGGEMLTFGSDSHVPKYIEYGLNEAKDLLLSLGFKYHTTYLRQVPHMEIIE